uniref:DUF4201 domain-containing protein n=1 Tax=Anopheles atroparvus TaxID=41427 RepID=A0A182JEL4_ANOAO
MAADDDDKGRGSMYCTLPRKDNGRASGQADRNGGLVQQGQYCTLRHPVGGRRTPQSPSASVAMGSKLAKAPGSAAKDDDDQPEANRSLLYEQNMCTFENFCERRNGEQRLQRCGSERDTNPPGDTESGEGLGNFCTLRSGRRGESYAHSTPRVNNDKREEEEVIRDVVVAAPPSVCVSEEQGVCSQSLQYYQLTGADRCVAGSERSGDYQEDRIRFGDIKHFCTLPKRKRTQFLNAFKRGASLRRTIVDGTTSESERQVDGGIVSEVEIGGERSRHLSDVVNESDQAVAALEALIARRKREHHPGPTPPLSFNQFRAFCLGWVRRCETATQKVRHQTHALVRAVAEQRKLLEEKLQSLGSDALRVNLEAFRLERRSGERELQAAQRTDYELRRLGAEVKREMLREKMALFQATVSYGRARSNLDRKAAELDGLRAKIERAEREVAQLEQENAQLRARLSKYHLPSVVEMAQEMEKLRKVREEEYGALKRGVLNGSIVRQPGGENEDGPRWGEPGRDAVTRSKAKRKVRTLRNLVLVLFVEPLRIEAFWLGIVAGVVMQPSNRYGHAGALRDGDLGLSVLARDCVLLGAHPIAGGVWRPLAQRLRHHHVQIAHSLQRVVGERAAAECLLRREDLVVKRLLNVGCNRQLVRNERHGVRDRVESGHKKYDTLRDHGRLVERFVEVTLRIAAQSLRLVGRGETFMFLRCSSRFRLLAQRTLPGFHQQVDHVGAHDAVLFPGRHRLAEQFHKELAVLAIEKVYLQPCHQLREHLVAHHLEEHVRAAKVGDLLAVPKEHILLVPEGIDLHAESARRNGIVGEANKHVPQLVLLPTVGLRSVVLHHALAALDDQLEHVAHLAAGELPINGRRRWPDAQRLRHHHVHVLHLLDGIVRQRFTLERLIHLDDLAVQSLLNLRVQRQLVAHEPERRGYGVEAGEEKQETLRDELLVGPLARDRRLAHGRFLHRRKTGVLRLDLFLLMS